MPKYTDLTKSRACLFQKNIETSMLYGQEKTPSQNAHICILNASILVTQFLGGNRLFKFPNLKCPLYIT